MRQVGIHPPDPDHPKGMAFVFAAGVVDPRPGGYPKKVYPNQLWALKESWEPTSELWWELGLRYHPELATKWIDGGGQFTIGKIVDTPPDDPSDEEYAAQMAEDQFEQMSEEIKRVIKSGDTHRIKQLRSRFRQAGVEANRFADMISAAIKEQEKK